MTTPLSTKNKYGEEEEEEEDDDDDEAKADAEMSDLFGNDNDVLEERHTRHSSPTASGPESERLLSPERERRQALEYGEDDAPPEIAVEVKEAEVRFPNLPVPKASDGDNWVIRMPNYVKVDTKPFHPDTYIGPEHEDEELAQGDSVREKSMSIKLKVENTLRWRWAKDANGQDKKESNSRIIRWSDGTLSLRLGKELFDINQSIDTSASVVRQTIGGTPSQSQSQPPATPSAPTPGKSEGLTYLVAQHKRSQVLQSEAVITGYMSLRPTGMQSETHMMLVRAVEQKHKQVARLKMAPNPSIDPEREKMEMIKQSAKKSKKKADDGERLGSRRRRNYRRSAEGPTWSDDDEVDHADMYGASDEDDDDMGINRSPRKQKRKASGEKGEEDYQADDFVVPDESEDDGDGAGRSRKRARDGDEPEDELERMEANLEKQAAAEKRSKKKGGDDDEEDSDEDGAGAMDVESEEEEEKFKVRRVTSKRAIALDDEDE
ncbi:Leo1-domain-containing protein [Agrocybe pediades]|nr:Leo1-domain-containing protein [Agrocybe pediades]